MTPHEQQLLQDFLAQMVAVKGIAKDPAAESMIAQAVGQQPDAAYLLVQRALLAGEALNAAQAKIDQLEAAARSAPAVPVAAASFLDSNAWGRRPTASQASTAAAVSVTGAPLATPGRGALAPAATAAAPARSNFLGTAAGMAAGVVGGAFLFQGINHLMNQGKEPVTTNAQTPPPAAEPISSPVAAAGDDESFDSAMDDSGGDDDSYA